MQNKLKPATTGVIEVLNEARIRTIMATGDNVLTAISVGRECSIIDSETEVFLGDVRRDGSSEKLFWKSTKTSRHNLNRETLEPNKAFYDDEMKRPGFQHNLTPILEEPEEQSYNDIIEMNDFPWQHLPEDYSIAITGKAFNMLVSSPSEEHVLHRVLLKA